MSKHTLSVLVENKPGVLARIAALFSRRGFNIDSLAVGPTEHPEISRMTVVVDVDELPLEQVTKQLNKLVEVLKVVELEGPRLRAARDPAGQGPHRPAEPQPRPRDRAAVPRQGGRRRPATRSTIEVTGNRDKLNAFLEVLEPFGIKELVQSGHGGHRSRVPVDHRPGAAHRLSHAAYRLHHRTASPNTTQRQPNLKEWPTWPRCSTTTTQT